MKKQITLLGHVEEEKITLLGHVEEEADHTFR